MYYFENYYQGNFNLLFLLDYYNYWVVQIMNHKSPSQRLERSGGQTGQVSAIGIGRLPQSGNGINVRNRQHRSPMGSPFLRSPQRYHLLDQESPQIQDKITNLQKMLQREKYKRQSQFFELFEMINSIKIGQQNLKLAKQPSFIYAQGEYPMTPRSNIRDTCSQADRQHYITQTYTPLHQTITKKKDEKQRQKQFHQARSYEQLIKKVQKQNEQNNNKIIKLQQQISKLKLLNQNERNQKSPKIEQVPIQIQKLVREQFKLLKNQFETKNKNIQITMSSQIDRKIEEKINSLKAYVKVSQFSGEMRKLEDKITIIENSFNNQFAALEEKTSNQIYTINDIVQEKFNFFKDSLMDQIFKSPKNQDQIKLKQMILQEKKRIDQIQQTNSTFFGELEKTMENIQKKLKNFKNQEGQGDKHKQKDTKLDVLGLLRKQKDSLHKQISMQIKMALMQQQQKLTLQIKNISHRIQKLEDIGTFPSACSLLRQNSLSTQKSMGNLRDHHEWTPPVYNHQPYRIQNTKQVLNQDESFQDSNANCSPSQNLQQLQIKLNGQINQIMALISDNCSYLETRNCNIEESVAEIVWVINDIVMKIKTM